MKKCGEKLIINLNSLKDVLGRHSSDFGGVVWKFQPLHKIKKKKLICNFMKFSLIECLKYIHEYY